MQGPVLLEKQNHMKLPAMNELLRIIAAAGITLLVVALAIMFFMWVFSSADREHRRVQPSGISNDGDAIGNRVAFGQGGTGVHLRSSPESRPKLAA